MISEAVAGTGERRSATGCRGLSSSKHFLYNVSVCTPLWITRGHKSRWGVEGTYLVILRPATACCTRLRFDLNQGDKGRTRRMSERR